ncbi:helix-turn-helix domain-containing protein [Amycolatopsis sp. CA-126428]|uniref:helix-turn-helix domain-containing protein n=1 Tax=Amycolatopsis sp. CA-126428 TaxID=2073158 RepID=UPI000CD16702|nr:helix-turn-helix domain-containing protein [Amycolatopsis sp. CA-126428]
MLVIDTDDVDRAEAFDYYRHALAGAAMGMELRTDRPADFRARLCAVDLGGVVLMSVRSASGAFEVARTRASIGRSDPEAFRVLLGVDGRNVFRHCGRSTVVRPGDMALYDSSRTFEGRREPGAGGTEHIVAATFPRSALPVDPRELRGECLPAGGVGTLVRTFLAEVAGAAVAGRDAGQRLACAWLDLLTVHLGDLLDPVPARDAADRTLFLRIGKFIDTHLADPALTPDAVAAAHFISPRTLQRLFARHDATVAARIRQRRLARCREDLRDPALAGLTVRAIAARWGFPDQAQFSRVFRRTYGTTPRAWRAGAQG